MREYQTENRPAAEAFFPSSLLAVSGGFLDAYTFFCRDQVFANAQTGNVVRVGIALARGEWGMVFRFLIPIMAFLAGVILAMVLKDRYGGEKGTLWQRRVLTLEILVAVAVGLIPVSLNCNIAANIMVSFLCAMQAETFRKVEGRPYASTMCTGNLRSGMEFFYQSIWKKEKNRQKDAARYLGIILAFMAGAVIGTLLTELLREKAVLLVAVFLTGTLLFLSKNN